MQLAWAEIGVTLTLRDEDRAAVVARRRNKSNHETALAITPSFKAVEAQMMRFNTPKEDGGVVFMYETEELQTLYHQLQTTVTQLERDQILIQMGDIKYYHHEWIPLFWVPIETILDPRSSVPGRSRTGKEATWAAMKRLRIHPADPLPAVLWQQPGFSASRLTGDRQPRGTLPAPTG